MKEKSLKDLNVHELQMLCKQWPFPENLKPIAHELLKEIMAEHPLQEQPGIIHLCGIPGSGKSTYAKKLKQENPEYYVLAFDRIMSQLPDYQENCEKIGLKQAFANWELPARGMGYHFLKVLLSSRRSIIFDHSAANSSHVKLLEQIGAIPYRVELHHTLCSIETALARVRKRERETQRHTPEHYLSERAELIERLLPEYQQVVHRYMEVAPTI